MRWPSERRAAKLYRNGGGEAFHGPALEEALALLSHNDFQNLARRRATHVRGKLSWTRLAEGAARGIGSELAAARTDGEVDEAVERAEELRARLEARDALPGVRITAQTRHAVGQVARAARALDELRRVADGTLRPDHDTAARAGALRVRMRALGGEGSARRLVEAAAAAVLGSGASEGVKVGYTRALAAWLPPEERAGSAVEWDD